MKTVLLAATFIAGASVGIALTTWVFTDRTINAGQPKYHRSDFRQVPPSIAANTYGNEPHQWEFSCISSAEKDCPHPIEIPEPATAGLMALGLIGTFFYARRK